MSADKQIESVLRKRFGKVDILESNSTATEERLMIRRRHLVDVLKFLKSDADTQIDLLVDLSAIQHLDDTKSSVFSQLISLPFFEVFYVLRSTRLHYRVRISIMVPEELPSITSIGNLFRNAYWLEREMWDLQGIYVEGSSHLQRLIMYPSFAGHPLRKDYPLQKVQPLVRLKANPP